MNTYINNDFIEELVFKSLIEFCLARVASTKQKKRVLDGKYKAYRR